MGKGTDKLYITHSEWSSSDAYSASVGANASGRGGSSSSAPFRRLPFNFCAASLQPFKNPVCTPDGTIFDVEVIGAWLDKHPNQNPVTGEPLHKKDLIRLNFARNAESDSLGAGLSDGKGDLVDPVTFKVFTDNTHIVAVRHGAYANVFAWETVERMNIKPKMWLDLVDDEPFTRADVITLQDPQNAASRNLDQFKFLRDGGEAQLTKEQEEERKAGARKAREAGGDVNRSSSSALAKLPGNAYSSSAVPRQNMIQEKKLAANSAAYTTGRAAASFTSTGLTPETSGERALLTDEEFMLKPRRTETAPRAVWNFIRLAQKGYYRGVAFHRNIPGFMIQGGDPSGTGKGGASIWGKYFNDEFDGPLTHNARGIVSMANKGKNTNSSQFFITYKPTPHLDRKHTIFGMEAVPTDGSNRPLNKILIKDVVVLIDPFEEFQSQRKEEERRAEEREQVRRQGGTDDDRTTWTGKRIRGDGTIENGKGSEAVGKYLKAAAVEANGADGTNADDVDTWEEPVKKSLKAGDLETLTAGDGAHVRYHEIKIPRG
ncbi:hypothetical protein ACCO45_002330 [Purpureocillium lilacinum]|uniref:Uncharacterized protein n=1 Tax=Purpureocillium lilacinum TaxID=33203 RepID=A0ACC4E9P0_PURLI